MIGIEVDHRGTQPRHPRQQGGDRSRTGGSIGNVNFRRMFDPRLTEEYCGLAGMPWSDQDASGEIAAMAIGAALWGLFNQTGEFGFGLTKAGRIGCQYGYRHLNWQPEQQGVCISPARPVLRSTDWQNVILVNMLGQRFYDETGGQFTANNLQQRQARTLPGSYLNAKNITYESEQLHQRRAWPASATGTTAAARSGRSSMPTPWRARTGCRSRRSSISREGFFFSADTHRELAAKIRMKYQRVPMPPDKLGGARLRATIRLSSWARTMDFGKPTPRYKIATPPFYAAWSTPVLHDTRAGPAHQRRAAR